MGWKDAAARSFADPPSEYGAIDGWWWEAGRLDEARLRWQLEELKDKGIAGSWFYARYVYDEPLASDPRYFSDGWWDFTRFAAREQRRLGLRNYVSLWTQLELEQDAIRAQRAAEPELWGRRLVIHRVRSAHGGPLALELPEGDELLDAAAYRADGETLDPASRVALSDAVRDGRLVWEAPDAGWQLTAVAARPWDLDYLDPQIGERWIDVVLGEYERRMPGALGETVHGFGPDEMKLLDGSTLCSAELLADVRERLGEDPAPLLVALFHDLGAATDRIRCAWYDAMCARLGDAFYEAPARWLHARGMRHATISQLGDDPLTHTFHYGDFLRYMRSFDIPGNEDPGNARAGERRLLQTKISSSLARLGASGGRAVVLAHYCAGWGHTLEENVAWTTEAYAKGMNLYSRHLASYSLMGGWYEYVPPSDHFYHPYWRYWRHFADWVRRLSFLMSQGRHRADVALLYPTSTIHAHWIAGREREGSGGYAPQVPDAAAEPHHPGDIGNVFVELEDGPDLKAFFDPPAHAASQGMIALAEAIYQDGIDFDVVDAPALARASVRGDVLELDGVELRCLLLPPCTTLPLAVMELAKRFYDAGGSVGAYGRLPDASVERGRGDPALRALVEHVFGPDAAASATTVVRRGDAAGSAFFVPGDVGEVPRALVAAIGRDVEVDGGGVFHTHQHADGDDVYLLFNTEERERALTVRLRVDAEVEAWDPFDGTTHPLHRVRREGGMTEVALTLGVFGSVVLVCSPPAGRPAVVEDDLSELTDVAADEEAGTVTLTGFAEEGGVKRARVLHGGRAYAGEVAVDAPPAPIALDGPFAFRLEPTMDNRWGDYRHPPSPTTIGAEARRFRHRAEGEVHGAELGWHAAGFDDAAWDEVQFSHGPYWRQLGPFAPGAEPEGTLARALRGDAQLDWRAYELSQQFGSQRQSLGWKGAEHLAGVSENFLILDGPPGAHHYLATTVVAPQDTERLFVFGRQREPDMVSVPVADREPFGYRVPAGTRLWIGGEEIALPLDEAGPEIAVRVRLRRGPNAVLLRVVQADEAQALGYAAFVRSVPEPDPYVPRLRWFAEPQELVYDIAPERPEPVAWYRFTAPPGVRRIHLDARCRGLEAWVDGQPVAVAGGAVVLDAPAAGPVAVALRVRQQPGAYGGAAFEQPISFDCEEGAIALGDWSAQGLATYSGIGVYATEVELTAAHLEQRATLDLGRVKTVAELLVNGEPAGVRIARPFRFDVTDLLREGVNRIEVKVANTLANHMSTYPTIWIFEGQTVSGLLGPVELRFAAPLRLIARPVA